MEEKKFKLSKYNYVYQRNKVTYSLNFLYNSIIQLKSESIVCLLKSNIKDGLSIIDISRKFKISENALQTLIEHKFLIDASEDELSLLKYRYRCNLYKSDSLRLVILPTMNCNFDCPYCYEFKENVSMSDETITNLVNWANELSVKVNTMRISWFGGEPLLCKDKIYYLSEKFLAICEQKNINYASFLTTNGFFLDKEFIDRLYDLKIASVVVTLDGDEEHHNETRFLKNKKPSFRTIYNNILAFCETDLSQTKLILRINCTDYNYEKIYNLLESFPDFVRAKVEAIYFRWVYPAEASGFKEFSRKMQGDEPFKNLSKLYNYAKSIGWNIKNPKNSEKFVHCEAETQHHYYISPEGNVFQCSHATHKEFAIGNVNHPGIIYDEKKNYVSKWFADEPFDYELCQDCILLPKCYGGCRKHRIDGKLICIEEKKSIEDFAIQTLIENGVKINDFIE